MPAAELPSLEVEEPLSPRDEASAGRGVVAMEGSSRLESQPITRVGVGTLLYNSTSILALPSMVDTLYDALVQQASNGELSLEGTIQSLPYSLHNQERFDAFVSLFASLVITIPFAFVAAQFVTPLVRERESGSKQMQFISGAGPLAYWLANWAWDLLLYMVIAGASLAVFKLEDRQEYTGTAEVSGATALLLVLFGFAVVPLACAASFAFSTPSNGLIVLITFHFLTGFGLNVIDFTLSIFNWEGPLPAINRALRGLYCCFPAYCLGQGFYVMATRDLTTIQAAVDGGSAAGLYDWSLLGAPLVYLGIEGMSLMGLTLLLQVS